MLKSQIESVLFVSSNAINLEKLKRFFKVETEELKAALENLKNEYSADSGRGVMLLIQEHSEEMKNEYQIVSNTENLEIVQKFLKLSDSVDLTKIALETLTIIAYRGPVKRTELEYVRGVNSRQILNQLLSRELVIEVEPDVFESSIKFLQIMGLNNLEDLSNYENLHNLNLMPEIENHGEKLENDIVETQGEEEIKNKKEEIVFEKNVETQSRIEPGMTASDENEE